MGCHARWTTGHLWGRASRTARGVLRPGENLACGGAGNGAVTSPNPSRLTPSIEPVLARRRVGRRGRRWIRSRAAGRRGRSNAEACGHVEFDFAVRPNEPSAPIVRESAARSVTCGTRPAAPHGHGQADAPRVQQPPTARPSTSPDPRRSRRGSRDGPGPGRGDTRSCCPTTRRTRDPRRRPRADQRRRR